MLVAREKLLDVAKDIWVSLPTQCAQDETPSGAPRCFAYSVRAERLHLDLNLEKMAVIHGKRWRVTCVGKVAGAKLKLLTCSYSSRVIFLA